MDISGSSSMLFDRCFLSQTECYFLFKQSPYVCLMRHLFGGENCLLDEMVKKWSSRDCGGNFQSF